jgi:flagellar biosynthesis chaperone FliJ
MRRNPLPVLLRLRATDLDAARAELVQIEHRMLEARRAVQAAELAIHNEMAAAASVQADDAAVQAFANWLPIGRASVARAKALRTRAEEDSLHARTIFNLARIALEAVQNLMDEQRAAQSRTAIRNEQNALDEIGGRRGLG